MAAVAPKPKFSSPKGKPKEKRGKRVGGATDWRVVRWCRELDRVLQVPARELDLSQDLTEEFRRPGSTAQLKPIQSAALAELRATGGLFAMMRAGIGKTLVGLLAFRALPGVRKAIYLAPAAGRWRSTPRRCARCPASASTAPLLASLATATSRS